MRGGLSVAAVEYRLDHESSQLGVSEILADTGLLAASSDPRPRKAIGSFASRAARELGALAITLEGLDALVFAGGGGEPEPAVRAAIGQRLRWIGLELDQDANAANATLISRRDSRAAAFVVPTDEGLVVVRQVQGALDL